MQKQNTKGDWFKIERVGAGAVVSMKARQHSGHLRSGVGSKWRVVFPKMQMTSEEVKDITTNGMKIEAAVDLFVKRVKQ
jgi:hypothetical protein|tara:strand:- start:1321 stop:1557 length:237 start_codon:yes stop_codon:yes gene_type:complete